MKRAMQFIKPLSASVTGLIILACLPPLMAATLTPGQTATVNPGAASENWSLNGATLNVLPGATTLNIAGINTSTLLMDGGTATASNGAAVTLTDSITTISSSTLTASSNFGLNLITVSSGTTHLGSRANVANSTITGLNRGINATFNSVVTLVSSQVTGTGSGSGGPTAGGVGMTLFGATATLQNSSITGANRGVLVSTDVFPGSNLPRLNLDGSSITGTNGAAITVLLNTQAPNATIGINNSSTLSGGNGVILDALGNSTVTFTVDNSALTGNVQGETGSLINATLNNNASITGDMTNINSLALNSSTMTGNVNVPVGSAATVALTNNSRLTGSLTNIASLNISSSAMTGNVAQSSGSQARVELNNSSSLTGSLSNIGSLAMDNSSMTGDVVQDAATPSSLNLSNNSVLSGTVSNAQSMSIDGTSRWNMVNNSSVGSLNLNGGTVSLGGTSPAFKTLTLGSLSGNGIFALGTDLAGHLSDLIDVTGNAAGSHTLSVQNTGIDPVQEDHGQRLVHTGSGDAVFAVPGGQVDVGTFVYRLEKRGTDWYLVQATTDPVDPVDPGDGGGIITPSARAVIGVFSAAPTVWYGEASTLRSRMGELRNGQNKGGGWVRTYGNKHRVSAADQVNYTQTQQGISFGVDTPISSTGGQWLIGVMGGYSNSDLNMRLGTSGQVNSYYAGVYSTWLSESGYYIDALIKANRFENKADVRMSDGVKSEGDYSNYGIGGSVEAGKHIRLGDGWFVEPYAQVSSLWVQGEDYGLDNGLEARSNNADSFVGKLGSHLGRTIALAKGGFVQPYVKVAVAQEFAQSNKVKVNRTTFSDDLSGSRGELGAGVALQITDVLQLHADIDYSNGENIEQPWGANVGMRFSW